jgi:hypothetical protein
MTTKFVILILFTRSRGMNNRHHTTACPLLNSVLALIRNPLEEIKELKKSISSSVFSLLRELSKKE